MLSTFLRTQCHLGIHSVVVSEEKPKEPGAMFMITKYRELHLMKYPAETLLTLTGIGSSVSFTAAAVETLVSGILAIIGLIVNLAKKENSFSKFTFESFDKSRLQLGYAAVDLFIFNIASFSVLTACAWVVGKCLEQIFPSSV